MSPKNIKKRGLGELKRELKFVEKEFPDPEKFQESLQKIEANGNVEKLKNFLEYLGLSILANDICLLQRFLEHRIAEMRKSQPITT